MTFDHPLCQTIQLFLHTRIHSTTFLGTWKNGKKTSTCSCRQSINLYCLCLYPLMLDMFQRKGYKIENVSLRWLGDWHFQFCMMMVMVGMARWCYITIQSVQVNGGGQEYWPIMDQPTITDQHTITTICRQGSGIGMILVAEKMIMIVRRKWH